MSEPPGVVAEQMRSMGDQFRSMGEQFKSMLASVAPQTVSVPPPQSPSLLESVGLTRAELLNIVVRLALAGGLSFFLIRWMVKELDPTNAQKAAARKKAEKILRKLGLNPNMDLSAHEVQIATALVSGDTDVAWEDVGGAEELIAQIQDRVLLPLSLPTDRLRSSLIAAPKGSLPNSHSGAVSEANGVLLYGPPGCGKTLLAKAVAKAANAAFINLDISTLTDKWYGESQKLAGAVFSLAVKLQPSIIFIDEIDSFLRSRESADHEATAMMKAQFMSLWDGFLVGSGRRVVVMGATNRPQDIDSAFLRRLPCRFYVSLPSEQQRNAILNVILTRDTSRVRVEADLGSVAAETKGFSGSDLRELCILANTQRIKEIIASGIPLDSRKAAATPLTQEHFARSVEVCRKERTLINLQRTLRPTTADSAPLD